MKRFFSKKELTVLFSLLILCIIAILCFRLFPGGRTYAAVYYKGEKIAKISLDRDNTYYFDGDLPVTLTVKNGAIRFEGSVCPDKICEGFGWISGEYEYAICAPAGITVIIE